MANALVKDFMEIQPTPKDPSALVAKLMDAYSEPKRTYYTIQRAAKVRHLLLTYVDEVLVNPDPNQILAAKMSIWFQDAVRNPSWDDCEERSAEMATSMLGSAYNINRIALKNNIVAFRTRKAMPHTVTSCALDANLTVLSYSEDVYFKAYLPALRRDYSRFSDKFWDVKRREYAEELLGSEKIFFNMPSLEEDARKNLRKELHYINSRNS